MIDQTLTKDFGRIWPQHVAALTQFLIDCRRHFDGDVDLFLVMCVINYKVQKKPNVLNPL